MPRTSIHMRNIYLQKRRILIPVCLVGMLCLVVIFYFSMPKNKEIPKLHLPAVGGSVSDNTQVNILDSLESDINSTSQTLSVYRLKPIDIRHEKEKIQNLFDVSSADIGAFPTGNTLSDGTTIAIDSQTGRWFYQKPIDFDAKGGPLSDNEAIQFATDFIANNDLYPLQSLGDAKIGSISTGDATQGTEEVLRKNVYFYPQIDGQSVHTGTVLLC